MIFESLVREICGGFLVASFLVGFPPGKIGLKFVTETSPHSSHRSSQERNLSPRAHSGGRSHIS